MDPALHLPGFPSFLHPLAWWSCIGSFEECSTERITFPLLQVSTGHAAHNVHGVLPGTQQPGWHSQGEGFRRGGGPSAGNPKPSDQAPDSAGELYALCDGCIWLYSSIRWIGYNNVTGQCLLTMNALRGQIVVWSNGSLVCTWGNLHG